MATNKHAQIRYLALDRCFSNFGRRYSINDLVDACNAAIYEFTGLHEGVRKRQVYEDIKLMESTQGWSIELERIKTGRQVFIRYIDRHYSINKSPINPVEFSQIQDVLLTLSRFRGMPQFEWVADISNRLQTLNKTGEEAPSKIIDFEQNQFVKGLDLISPLFNSIINKRVIEITYQPFKSNEQNTFQFHPYYLKQYNLRWFVFGHTGNRESITNLALDRIVSINEINVPYLENNSVDFNEYFDDIIGVTLPKDAIAEKVVLFVANARWPYVMTKPIHGSQRPPRDSVNGVTIELEVIINPEFVSRILSYGKDIIVLEPAGLVNQIKNHIQELNKSYS